MNWKHGIAVLAAVLGLGWNNCRAEVPVRAAAVPELAVVVGPGQVTLANGKSVAVAQMRLTIEGPEIREFTTTGKAPGDLAPWHNPWDSWPVNALNLSPGKDEKGALILGFLYRSVQPETVVLTTADGSKTFVRGEDYVFNEKWAQVLGLKGRLGNPDQVQVRCTAKFAMKRLDLVQVDGSGKASIKRGQSVMVCPQLPEPDAGAKAIAGVYVAPWRQSKDPALTSKNLFSIWDINGIALSGLEYVVTNENIYSIEPVAPVAPINPQAVAKSLAKLRAGQELKVAFLGDSLSEGAEAGAFWADRFTEKNLGYPSRVVVALRKLFPKATVTPISASKGGTQAKEAVKMFDEGIKDADLVIISYGGNDANGAVMDPPNNSPDHFKMDLEMLVQKAKSKNMEVLLLAGPNVTPWMANRISDRYPVYRHELLEVAKAEQVGCADVFTEWNNLAKRGIPPFTQMHNDFCHPGTEGHGLIADVILRFFPGP